MRRLIAHCLIVSLLFSVLAWSADMHAEAFFGHEAEWSQVADSQHDTTNAAETCDHCCHSGAHFLGFPITTSVLTDFGRQPVSRHREAAHLSLALPPPTEPPIA